MDSVLGIFYVLYRQSLEKELELETVPVACQKETVYHWVIMAIQVIINDLSVCGLVTSKTSITWSRRFMINEVPWSGHDTKVSQKLCNNLVKWNTFQQLQMLLHGSWWWPPKKRVWELSWYFQIANRRIYFSYLEHGHRIYGFRPSNLV